MPYNLVTFLGPTATGKTRLAARLAKDLKGEIISADSRQVYRGMDIGTGKDLHELTSQNINYYLIDLCEPTDEYNLFRFKQDFTEAFLKIKNRKHLPILVGGTGLYLSSVLQNYDLPILINENNKKEKLNSLETERLREILIELRPEVHNTTDLINRERLIKAILIEQSRGKSGDKRQNLSSLNIGIMPERNRIRQNITIRLKSRLQSGMIEEVKELINKGISEERLKSFGLEYKYITLYIQGGLNYNDMFQKLNSAIHNFAKRQITWFRKMEREGVKINWFSGSSYSEILNFVKTQLAAENAVA